MRAAGGVAGEDELIAVRPLQAHLDLADEVRPCPSHTIMIAPASDIACNTTPLSSIYGVRLRPQREDQSP